MTVLGIFCVAKTVAEDVAPESSSRPTIEREPNPKGPLSIDELSVNLGFEAGAEHRTVRTDPLGFRRPRYAQKNRQYRLEETLGLESRGSLIDERVLQYDAMFRWGLSQEWYEEGRPGPDLKKSPDGQLLEYDLRFQLFPAGKISAEFFASQLDDRIARPFLPSQDRRRERYGASLSFNDPKLPMELSFEHLFDDVQSGSRYLTDDEERSEDRLRYEVTWQPTEYHSLSLEYEFERRNEQYSGTSTRFDTTRNYVALDHVLQFGLDHRSRLDSRLRVEEEAGDLARDVFEFAPQLRLQHTDSLFTTYKGQFLKERFLDLETRTVRGDWGITHEIEDVLTSSLGLYALNQESNDNADLVEWGGLADFSFTQDNAWGTFGADLSYLHSETETNDGHRNGVVVSESVTFRDPLPATLAHRRVNRFEMIVTDAARVRVYLPMLDYIVVPLGEVTALYRVATGRILNGETVYVTYTHRSYDNSAIRRDRLDMRVKQRFKNDLEAYYALSLQFEEVDKRRYLTFRERDISRHRIGLTYRKPRWSAGLEYELNDDSIDPYQAIHANGDVVFFQNARHQLDGRTNFSAFRFDGMDYLRPRETMLLDLGLSYRYVLGANLEANASASYRFEHDSRFGDTRGVDLASGLAYKIGLFSVLLETEYDMLDLPTSTDSSTGVWLKLRRDIPIIGKRATR